MFVYFQRVAISNSVKSTADLTIPPGATHAEIQAESSAITDGVNYTMDGTAPTVSSGMILPSNVAPKLVLIEDMQRIKFIRRGVNDTALLVHYVGITH